MPRLLVVGVRPNSLGWHVVKAAEEAGWETVAADLWPRTEATGYQVHRLDVCSPADLEAFWGDEEVQFDAVVYAAGVNLESSIRDPNWRGDMAEQMGVNFAGAIQMLQHWLNHGRKKTLGNSFVTIASNSAYIPRSRSMSYCASKAAVVMAMRCVARELASGTDGDHPSIYTYSPGWLNGTPMSREVYGRIPPDVPLHRIPGEAGVNPEVLAQLIVRNLNHGDQSLNGCDLRIDGGEV